MTKNTPPEIDAESDPHQRIVEAALAALMAAVYLNDGEPVTAMQNLSLASNALLEACSSIARDNGLSLGNVCYLKVPH